MHNTTTSPVSRCVAKRQWRPCQFVFFESALTCRNRLRAKDDSSRGDSDNIASNRLSYPPPSSLKLNFSYRTLRGIGHCRSSVGRTPLMFIDHASVSIWPFRRSNRDRSKRGQRCSLMPPSMDGCWARISVPPNAEDVKAFAKNQRAGTFNVVTS
jgi:hypothetical protein